MPGHAGLMAKELHGLCKMRGVVLCALFALLVLWWSRGARKPPDSPRSIATTQSLSLSDSE